ncbi:MAG: hypothetical protein Q7W45_08045 [Bacteroidota bacterium]|nr:hypothetical protein [Bacteroidota bacterium]MDP3145954.1 hypothetical protein [Bacteroidota bacterium]MDP3558589.1 hypothetical protein [Bacteroidota bacterium]
MSREEAKVIIEKLVERFAEHREDYHLMDYYEKKTIKTSSISCLRPQVESN